MLKDELCLFGYVVLTETRIVVPHPGIVSMKNRLRSEVWWDGNDKESEKLVRSCQAC